MVVNLGSSAAIFKEEGVDFNDPSTKTFFSLHELLTRLETKGKWIYDIKPVHETLYIDVYPIFTTIHKMSAEELAGWLKDQGISFSLQTIPVTYHVLHSMK